MMTGSELSLVLILILLVRTLLIASPWPAALLVAASAAGGGLARGLAAAAGVVLAVLGWTLLGWSGLAGGALGGPWLTALSALVLLGFAGAAARPALGRAPQGPGSAAVAIGLAALLHGTQPGVALRWASQPGQIADLGWSALPGLALVAVLYAALAYGLSRPRPRAAYARHARMLQGALAGLYLLGALIALLRLA
ncbi:hypothetical protein [Pararhodobacter aggregans]|uniref:hypothetical protein n=1 Tax=Pararhodobacter aggregans TaxID=404875 RepID=UPI003A9587B2